MITISQLAKQFGISRTTLLYYEREGLLLPASRSDNGYRWYGPKEQQRLETIKAYRAFGVPVAKLASILDGADDADQEQLLREQFAALESEIQRLKLQQKAIVQRLNCQDLHTQPQLSKAGWVNVMRAAGLSDQDMSHWHRQFEQMEPDAHQEFLETLNIDADEIQAIRQRARDA
ncbi:MerR family transcriptional regulator [Ferrimonas pelagia]|uniref:MerR family transcriptional regulator n=1 Tax=Ferrimonas pelagia TaxID=1177826 RepID=A0ABP9FC97_9GAMM